MKKHRIDDSVEWKKWDLNGFNVTQLRFDYQFHIHMWTLQSDLLVSFMTPFILHSYDGREKHFAPERNEALGPLLNLLHQRAKSFAASSAGFCILEFEDGTQLKGEPHKKYEAWESRGSGDLAEASLLCGIGGGSPWGKI